jgi:hypothetical protein
MDRESTVISLADPARVHEGQGAEYVPLLLDRRGERFALSILPEPTWNATMPLVQLPPKDRRDLPQQTKDPLDWIRELAAAAGDHALYLDCTGVALRSRRQVRTTASEADTLYGHALSVGLRFAPVYTIGQPDTRLVIRNVSASVPLGVAVRFRPLGLAAVGSRSVTTVAADELGSLGIALDKADLILDLGYLDPDSTVAETGISTLLEELTRLGGWRSVTIAATSVPESVSEFVNEGSINAIRRQEWFLWQRLVTQGWPDLRFGDYGIQNCLPPDPGSAPRMVASVRYTTEGHMYVSRGRGEVQRMSPTQKDQEYRDLAQRLFLHPPFLGRECCLGERFIEDCADGRKNVRSQQVWRGWGTLHHVVLTARQVVAARPVRRIVDGRAGARPAETAEALAGSRRLDDTRSGPSSSRRRRRGNA